MSKDIILNKKNCLITGATGSLGACLAQSFAKYGCNLFLTSKTKEKLENLKKQLESTNQDIKISYEPADFRNINDIYGILEKAKKDLGEIDILINNTGIFQLKALTNTTIEDINSFFDINIRSQFILCKELCKDMIKKRWGRIINIASTSAYNGFKNHTLYCATKHAILGFSRSLHDELKSYNVRVFCVSPGPLRSTMGELAIENSNIASDSFIEPGEVAEYITFAISFNKEMISEEIRLHIMKEHVEQH